ncbi:MAG: SRPBCC domain-containing protein [Acidimicrobiia bacterium]
MQSVEREVVIRRPVGEVWAVVADPVRLGVWLGGELEIVALRPGAGGEFRSDADTRRLVVTSVDPPAALSFVWWSDGDVATATTVTVELAALDGTTNVRVRETRRAQQRATA